MKLDTIFGIIRNCKGLLASFLWGVFVGLALGMAIDALIRR